MGEPILGGRRGPPGADGAAGAAGEQGPAGPSYGELVFIAGDVGTSTTTLYMVPGFIATASPDYKDFKVSRALTVTGLLYKARVGHTSPSGEQIFFSLRRDGNPESLALLISPGETSGDTTGQLPVSFAAGSTIGIQVDKANVGVSTSPVDAAVTLIITYP